jgi:hypothetical protein
VRIDLLRDTHLHGPAAYNAEPPDCYSACDSAPSLEEI